MVVFITSQSEVIGGYSDAPGDTYSFYGRAGRVSEAQRMQGMENVVAVPRCFALVLMLFDSFEIRERHMHVHVFVCMYV